LRKGVDLFSEKGHNSTLPLGRLGVEAGKILEKRDVPDNGPEWPGSLTSEE
jgi:hypothetical protein